MRCCDKPATANLEFDPFQPDQATAAAPHRVFNIGNSQPTELLRFIEVMEQALGRKAIKDFQPMQPGDVVATLRTPGFGGLGGALNPLHPLRPVLSGSLRGVRIFIGCDRHDLYACDRRSIEE